jgi:penicillin-binding protein 2
MAVMTAVVANGGKRVVPHLVRGAPVPPPQSTGPSDPELRERFTHALAVVREGLWAVVNDPGGTAYSTMHIDGADIAGKTGSVQVVAQKVRTEAKNLPFPYRDHGWFTSFAPAEDPKIVLVVFAEHGGGSHGATPIAKALYEKLLALDRHPDAS